MSEFRYIITVTADNENDADQVMCEHVDFEERIYRTPDGVYWNRDDAPDDAVRLEYSIDWKRDTKQQEQL